MKKIIKSIASKKSTIKIFNEVIVCQHRQNELLRKLNSVATLSAKRIPFHDDANIEERKRAINEAMQSAMPFELKRVLISIPGLGRMDYTGGFTQMLMAKAAIIQYSAKCTA